MRLRYAVTFEYAQRPPEVHCGEGEAGGPQTIAGKAVRDAKKTLKPRGWTSVVILLERMDELEEEGEE